ncbi:transcription termination/antitermination protein NusG [Candidatus Nitronereus thalassa]|uniref:Transcription termination/antitermination NusG family protein n=1 Tax=Candidatus Nitronereus thalassa TaxID=3020898 RepID=A0ABU3K6H0_9BACT|nr:transcription termination/antitermination NusG family protein [Candidatus Nitronereus thalassa]MDT7041988.1 transcription termination/antitermination NusG family protein [Candidatus Nitronereus thalassa]
MIASTSLLETQSFSASETGKSADVPRSHWFLVHVKNRAEKASGQNLDQLGLESFCPHRKQEKIIRRVRREVILPLFPGYLFVKFDPAVQFRAVQFCTGVLRVVTFGDTLARVDSSIIEAMRDRMTQGWVDMSNCTPFQPGQKVRIQDGPLRGLEAVFESEMSDRQRVTLLLKTVAYQARVVMPVDQITNL